MFGKIKEAAGKHIDGFLHHEDRGQQAPIAETKTRIPPTGEELNITVEDLGTTRASDSSFHGIARDGGGGGVVNGRHVVVFSDTLVRGVGPLTNTIVYLSEDDPTVLHEFGNDGVPQQGVPYIQEEKDYTNQGGGKTRIAIWPQCSIVTLPGHHEKGIAVAPVSIQSQPGHAKPSGDLYNTLYTITAHKTGYSVERTVPKLWHVGSIMYGTFCTFLDPQDQMLYFFAAEGKFFVENTGLKVARANPLGNYTDTSTWEFWTGDEWVKEPPKANTAKPVIDGVYSSGDIFWSSKYKTYMAVYYLAIADNQFRYRYALPDENGKVSLTGRWSKDRILHNTTHLKVKKEGEQDYGFTYAGHAYPDHDPTGESLVMSCTLNDGGTTYFFRARLN